MMKSRKFFYSGLTLFSAAGILCGVLMLCIGYFRMMRNAQVEPQYYYGADKNVLFISSYNSLNDDIARQITGFRKVFATSSVQFDVEYMDSQNYNSEESRALFHTLLKYKLENHAPYDAVVLSSDEALEFGLKYQDELFPGTPMVFLGVRDAAKAAEAAQNPLVTGTTLPSCIPDTIDLAIKFYPEARNIYAVFDNSPSGQKDQTALMQAVQAYPGHSVHPVNASELSRNALAEIIANRTVNDIIICLDIFEDADGNRYSIAESADFISHFAKIPVFTKTFTAIQHGFAGGKMPNFEQEGMNSARVITSILFDGVAVESVPPAETESFDFVFNYRTMKRMHLRPSVLPKGTIFVNRPQSAWYRYRSIAAPFIIIFCSLAVLLAAMCHSIITLRASRATLRYAATHDSLTGLPNSDSIQETIRAHIESKAEFCVLLLDIDDFKKFNDFNSHKFGDEILKELGRRLKALMEDKRYVASRYDGDNFMIVFSEHLSETSPDLFFVRQSVNNPVMMEQKTIFIRTHIGIVNSKPEFATVDDYLSNADIALSEAKKLGKNKYAFFTEELKEVLHNRAEIARILDDACRQEAFTVLYQPQIDTLTGKIHGYEALVRLSDSKIGPAEFIPVAEEDGHISKIGRIVTEKVIRQIATWRDSGVELHKVAINFSAGQIADRDYVAYLKAQLEQHHITSDLIGIEITESMFLESRDLSMELFKELTGIGITLALDDFGTGYSSLSYLTYLPVDTVKIDKTLVDAYLKEGRESFIQNIVNLVHSLGMKLTVEGVEHTWQYEKLREFKCDHIQGYLFSKPLDAAGIEHYTPPAI